MGRIDHQMKKSGRLADELVARGLAASVEEAHRLITGGRVTVNGAPALNPERRIKGIERLSVSENRSLASRGTLKLSPVLKEVGLDLARTKCLDVGAGSGGFTDALLEAGAESVVAVDVGYGQFDWRLRNDPRVRLLERTNIRTIDPQSLGQRDFDVIVADLSFISLAAVIEVLSPLADAGGAMVLLVKPQFEAPRESVPPGGVVVDPEVWKTSLRSVCDSLSKSGWTVLAVRPSSILGAEGNREFFVYARRGRPSDAEGLIQVAASESS